MKDIHTLHLSEKTRESINPFTEEVLRIPMDEGYTDADKDKFMRYLKSLRATKVNEDGFRQVSVSDVEVLSFRDQGLLAKEGLLVAIAFECRGLSLASAAILYKLLCEIDVVIRSGTDDIAHAKETLPDLALARWPNITKVNSPEQLLLWLEAQPDYH